MQQELVGLYVDVATTLLDALSAKSMLDSCDRDATTVDVDTSMVTAGLLDDDDDDDWWFDETDAVYATAATFSQACSIVEMVAPYADADRVVTLVAKAQQTAVQLVSAAHDAAQPRSLEAVTSLATLASQVAYALAMLPVADEDDVDGE